MMSKNSKLWRVAALFLVAALALSQNPIRTGGGGGGGGTSYSAGTGLLLSVATFSVNSALVLFIDDYQDGKTNSCITAGTTTAFTCAPTQAFTGSLVNGSVVYVRFNAAATGAATLNVSSLGDVQMRLQDRTTQLTGSHIAANQSHTFVYDSGVTAWICQSCASGGSAPAPVFDTYANRPAEPCTVGTVFYASDITAKHWVCGTGNTWKAVAFGMLLTEPPAAASWTTVVSSGGGSPTVTDVGGAIRYVGGSSGGSAIVRAVPGSTPYSVVLAYTITSADDNGQYLAQCGFVLTDGTATSSNRIITGVLDISNAGNQSDYRLHSNRFTNIATYNGTVSKKVSINPGMAPLLRYRDDGTNRHFELWDGSGWLTALSETRTTFLTATHYGFTCDSSKSSGTLYHWKP